MVSLLEAHRCHQSESTLFNPSEKIPAFLRVDVSTCGLPTRHYAARTGAAAAVPLSFTPSRAPRSHRFFQVYLRRLHFHSPRQGRSDDTRLDRRNSIISYPQNDRVTKDVYSARLTPGHGCSAWLSSTPGSEFVHSNSRIFLVPVKIQQEHDHYV